MKTYWDYTDKERSEFTEAQVIALLDVEMMEKGVLKPQPPALVPTFTPEDLGSRTQFFGISGKGKYGADEIFSVSFKTIEQANAFIALEPLMQDYEYDIGSEYKYAKPVSGLSIVTNELYSFDTINAAQANLKKSKAARDENARLQSEYTKACSEANKVTTKVWEDWHAIRATASEMKRVVSTFQEYQRLAGEPNLALKFLGKIFTPEKIQEAREWFPMTLPTIAPDVRVAPQPEKEEA